MSAWPLLTSHTQVLMCIATKPESRLIDIGDATGMVERTAYNVVNDLVEAGYIVKKPAGRRNHYEIQPDAVVAEAPLALTVGQVLDLLIGADWRSIRYEPPKPAVEMRDERDPPDSRRGKW